MKCSGGTTGVATLAIPTALFPGHNTLSWQVGIFLFSSEIN